MMIFDKNSSERSQSGLKKIEKGKILLKLIVKRKIENQINKLNPKAQKKQKYIFG